MSIKDYVRYEQLKQLVAETLMRSGLPDEMIDGDLLEKLITVDTDLRRTLSYIKDTEDREAFLFHQIYVLITALELEIGVNTDID